MTSGLPDTISLDSILSGGSAVYPAVTDQGLGIHKSRTTPYRPSGNGQVERYNRTLMDAVRCYIDSQPKTWDKYLGPLAGALRSAVNRHTGYTPNRLMLGREVNVPATLIYGPPPKSFQNGEEDEIDMYVQELEQTVQKSA